MTCLDVSNWDYPIDAQALVAAGVTQVIIGCQDEAKADAMAGACSAAGIQLLATYAFLYLGFDGFMGFSDLIGREMGKAIRVALRHGIQWVASDVEANGQNEKSNDDPPTRIADLRRAVGMVRDAGLNPFIYSGAWYWPTYMANTTEFKDLPLWHSEYPPDGHIVTTVNYGGWTAPHIHQYTSSLPVAGRNRDANYIITPLGEDMAALDDLKAQLDAMNKELVRRFALARILGDPNSANVDAAVAALQAAGLLDKAL